MIKGSFCKENFPTSGDIKSEEIHQKKLIPISTATLRVN